MGSVPGRDPQGSRMSTQVVPTLTPAADTLSRLKELALQKDPEFFSLLRRQTLATTSAEDMLMLAALRKRAAHKGLVAPNQKSTRVAILGGYTPHPLHELIGHLLAAGQPQPVSWSPDFLLGDYDNYIAEIVEESGRLYEFRPEVILLFPSHHRCQYTGQWTDPREQQESAARTAAAQILDLCRTANSRSGAEIILANFPLPARFDPGPYRTRTLASDWNFRKFVNLELGLNAPSYVHICDVEFLAARRGTLEAWDPRAWVETKQAYGRGLMLDVAREAAHLIATLRESPKKVVVLDLDNTLWGGVVGDDGLDGIEIGDTSPRGEAFKSFQQYLASLTTRGVLLAVCSKNDHDKAAEPFEKHPEMALRMSDFASFKANWQPKSENIRQIAQELNLGLDSLVFVDDNPAEIEIVNQFVPEVATLLLGPDPSEYVAQLQDMRWFEPKTLTAEDLERAGQYRQEAQRQELLSSVTDMNAYLESLEMQAHIREFRSVDAPRISQLINKSNQFNLTTRRRTEAQVLSVIEDPSHFHFTVRLADRFGDYGLISVVIGKMEGEIAEIDTWLMSCRVLKRQVEEEVLNEIVRQAQMRGAARIRGIYLPTPKNGMVRDHYPNLGFAPAPDTPTPAVYELDAHSYQPHPTKIRILERPYDAN